MNINSQNFNLMKNLITLFFVLLISFNLSSQSNLPKREFRAAWIATVTNLDWPSSSSLSTAAQKQELINLLDELQRDGINVVIFQVRTECDAFYSSPFDPWSYWLTGSQGTAPFPYYDPLEFAVDEAHKRGMELHAWFNPYRAYRQQNTYSTAGNHVTKAHPDWVITCPDDYKFLDPGFPAVRDYISAVVFDVVSRYDVDGVHFDDYFYPYPEHNFTNQDATTFATYPRGFTNLGDWRRDNVNIMVKQVYDTIQTVKPYVKFGISPFGVWKNNVPTGIIGLDAYSSIYCDAMAWLNDKSIDYLTPQLYWPFGGTTDYGKLQPWWADSVAADGRHFYPGHAYYRIVNWSASEIPNQIRFDRKNSKVQGGVFFRAKNFPENPKGVTDTLRNNLYKYKALLPVMNWKDVVPPNSVANLKYERLANGQAGLKWDLPVTASDGDSAYRYVVYRFDHSSVQLSELNDPSKIVSIEGSRQSLPNPPPYGQAYYLVTALDRNYNESIPTYPLLVNPPPVPVLAYPPKYATNVGDSVILKWNYPAHSAYYRLQVSTDSTFASNILFDKSEIKDTMQMVTILNGQQKYYWRVMSFNAGGTSSFSAPFSFTTGYPASTLLAYPLNNTGDIPTDTTLYWYQSKDASEYSFMLARSLDFSLSSIVYDVSGIADTFYNVSNLNPFTIYFWKVRASNQYGNGQWSEAWRFRTVAATGIEDEELLPTEFALEQNFPNPFNPSTTIRFRIPEAGLATLKIYNILGQEVAVLVEEYMNPGTYNVEFNTKSILNKDSSGIYIYRLRVNDYSASKKMILMK